MHAAARSLSGAPASIGASPRGNRSAALLRSQSGSYVYRRSEYAADYRKSALAVARAIPLAARAIFCGVDWRAVRTAPVRKRAAAIARAT